MADTHGHRDADRGRTRVHGRTRTHESNRDSAHKGKRQGFRGGATRNGAKTAENDRNWRRRDTPPSPADGARLRLVSTPEKMEETPIIGTLLTMCSHEEVCSRHEIKDISRFEYPPSHTDASWAVKKYRRPAAGRHDINVAELRPPRVLKATLSHLFTQVLRWPGCGFDWQINATVLVTPAHDFLALYHFMSDRLRSVRQDFVVQRVQTRERIVALVQIVRFYVLASFRAIQVVDSNDKTLDWSETLNDQQLASALTEIHAQFQLVEIKEDKDTTLQEEAVALDVILHLRDPRAVSMLLLKMPSKLLHRDGMRHVLALFAAFHTGDTVRFFHSYKALPILQQCLVLRHLPIIWTTSMLRMNMAYGKIDRFALSEISHWMHLPDAESTRLLCSTMNVHTEDETPVDSLDSPVDSWEDPNVVAAPYTSIFVKFKVNTIRDELDEEVVRKLLRGKAVSIQIELMQRSTATALIME